MSRKRLVLAVFLAPLLVYALFAWERLLHPTAQFHFVDLASSFLHGRLDTDTPTESASAAKPTDPPGYRQAIRRVTSGGGWNDWASYHVVTLVGGEVLKGVWPWGDQSNGKEKTFRTLDGEERIVDKELDIKKGCGGKPHKACDEKIHHVSFPPFPAVVMLPFTAVFGYWTNDVLLTVLFAAGNVWLLFLLLEVLRARGLSSRSSRENLAFALFFAFGTSHFFSSIRGEVWFTGLVMGVTVHTLFLLAALETRHPALAGLLLACGFLTRTPLLFAGGVFFGVQLLFAEGRWWGLGTRETLKRGALFAATFLPLFALALGYNQARFASPMEFGHTYIQDGMRPAIRDAGLMSFEFLNRNLAAAFTNFPRLSTAAPFVRISRHGLGLLWSTPVFWLLFRLKRRDVLTWSLLAATAAAAVPILLYQNTGWSQFTFRFSLDVTPLLLVLLAREERPLDRVFWALFLVAVVVQTFGAATFGRFDAFYYD